MSGVGSKQKGSEPAEGKPQPGPYRTRMLRWHVLEVRSLFLDLSAFRGCCIRCPAEFGQGMSHAAKAIASGRQHGGLSIPFFYELTGRGVIPSSNINWSPGSDRGVGKRCNFRQ